MEHTDGCYCSGGHHHVRGQASCQHRSSTWLGIPVRVTGGTRGTRPCTAAFGGGRVGAAGTRSCSSRARHSCICVRGCRAERRRQSRQACASEDAARTRTSHRAVFFFRQRPQRAGFVRCRLTAERLARLSEDRGGVEWCGELWWRWCGCQGDCRIRQRAERGCRQPVTGANVPLQLGGGSCRCRWHGFCYHRCQPSLYTSALAAVLQGGSS